jgi:uncharacterized protein (TIGR02679 family)
VSDTAGPGWAELVDDPGWARLLAASRRSLERTGGSLGGSISLTAPSEAERMVVIGATGAYRPASANRLRVPLTALDGYLREAYGANLSDVVSVTAPLRDRPGEAKREQFSRDAALSLARDGRHAGAGWYEHWLEEIRGDGTLTRVIRTGTPLLEVVRVLDALPADGEPMPAFLDRVLDSPKALAEGMVRGLLLRALAGWQGVPVPQNREHERALWESVGVVLDDLASQVLVLNLPVRGGLVGSWLASACEVGVPMRLTLHQLRLAPLTITGDEVFVCENPAVVRAAAVRLGARARPLVCTEGVPSAAAHELLRAAAQARVRWRNDFDWTGVRLTAGALTRYPYASPWRMGAPDYQAAAASGPPLAGRPVDTPWDPALREAMSRTGRAVMEERLLRQLLADLDIHVPSSQSDSP